MPDNPFSRVIRGREREDQDDGRETTREARETDGRETQTEDQWGEKGEALEGVKFGLFREAEGAVPKVADPIFQSKDKITDQNEADQSGSSLASKVQDSIMIAIDKQMAANMAKDGKDNPRYPDDENSASGRDSEQSENSEI